MAHYSPFEVSFHRLETIHLDALRSVSEGWYVEYKREVPNAGAIAKSVGAMSNTYGGWIFYGVEEQSKDDPVAGAFPGLPFDELDAAMQRIRQSVAGHLHPSPHFDVKALRGPCEEIGLAGDRAVLCLHVPYSRRTPHLHKSGVIYRRVGDGSEPRPESDRYAVDQLWRRGKELDERYEEWVDDQPEFSKGEGEIPYVRLLLTADLYRDHDAWLDADVSEVRALLKGDGVGIDLPFDVVHTTSRGFVANQSDQGDPSHMGLTWWLNRSLTSEILIPLNSYSFDDLYEQQRHGYKHAQRFASVLRRSRATDRGILDLNQLYFVFSGIVKKKQVILDRAGWKDGLWFKIQFLNVWRKTCFLDTELAADHVETHGAAFCRRKQIDVLPGTDADTFLSLSAPDPALSPLVQQQVRAAVMLEFICSAVGLPSFTKNEDEVATGLFADLHEASERAQNVQAQRARPSTTAR